jgi:hypothetical protein
MGGGKGLYRSKDIRSLLKKLEMKTGKISVTDEGPHWKVDIPGEIRSYPVPVSHKFSNRFIVDKLCKKLVTAGVCTEEEFYSYL